jgi:hypothetical protein
MVKKDYSDFQKRPQSDDALAKLTQLAEDQLAATSALTEAEEQVTAKKEALRLIAEVAVPELMDELGMEEFTTTSGIKVKVSTKIRASISAEHQAAAFRWLRENNHEALIKREVKMQFGMGEDEIAQETIEKLDGLPLQDKSSVHNGTLVKFITEMLEGGKPIPEELFNIHKQRNKTRDHTTWLVR